MPDGVRKRKRKDSIKSYSHHIRKLLSKFGIPEIGWRELAADSKTWDTMLKNKQLAMNKSWMMNEEAARFLPVDDF